MSENKKADLAWKSIHLMMQSNVDFMHRMHTAERRVEYMHRFEKHLQEIKMIASVLAADEMLWQDRTIGEAYIAQALRLLCHVIEGTKPFFEVRDALEEMRP